MFCNQRTRYGRPKQIFALVQGIGAEHREHEVTHEFLAQVLDEDVLLPDPHRERLGARRRDLPALTDVGGERDHLAAVDVLQPPENDRGVEPARVGEYDLAVRFFAGFPDLPVFAHSDFTLPRSRNSISAFCVCSRFSASSQTTLCRPSITFAATSSPRCAGRQCMNRASLRAAFIISGSTCQSSKSLLRASFSASKPIEVQTSVVTRCAPLAARIGSANSSKCVPCTPARSGSIS